MIVDRVAPLLDCALDALEVIEVGDVTTAHEIIEEIAGRLREAIDQADKAA